MRYAMILKNRVIDIRHSETEPHYPPDPERNPVTAVPCDETVEIGMIYDAETGEFHEYIPPKPEPIPEPPLTEQEQLAIDNALNLEYMVCLTETSLT